MSLVAADLAQAIMDANEGADTPADAGKIGDAIAGYIKDNATINYTWVGVNPSGSPDPTTSFSPTPGSPTAPWTMPSGATSAAAAMAALSGAINSFLSTVLLDASGFTLAPPLMLISTCVLSPSEADNREDAMTSLAEGIISGLMVTPAAAGAHGAFTGAASGGMIS